MGRGTEEHVLSFTTGLWVSDILTKRYHHNPKIFLEVQRGNISNLVTARILGGAGVCTQGTVLTRQTLLFEQCPSLVRIFKMFSLKNYASLTLPKD
jgi:hypothetical protein